MWEGHIAQTKLTDAELIRRCQSGSDSPAPWDDFFRRFLPFIDKRIIKNFLLLGISIDQDSVYTIRGELEERLFRDRILDKLDDVSNFKPWFRKVIRNQTIDWARKSSRFRDAAERLGKISTVSISDPVAPNGEHTFEEVIPAETIDNQKLRTQLANVLEDMDDLGERYRLVLKASIMFYEPLSTDDIEAIAIHRKVPAALIKQESETLMEDLQRRYERAARDNSTAVNLHAKIQFLETRLKELRSNPHADPVQKEQLKEKIQKKIERRKRLLANGARPIRPTSRQLADFLAIAEANATAINTLLHRARKVLIAKNRDVTNRTFSRLC
jgi:chaperonin cofactor prefoldin